jgi:MHS family shikimate/dehydroshikimate transporter-like MFS transporter
MAELVTSPESISPAATRKRSFALASSFFGHLIEYYDFFVYSLLATVAIGPIFFAGVGPEVALVASYATLATGYVIRPVGAAIMSSIGDRIGRRIALLISVAIMGVASILVGMLPTNATIGVWAPILLVTLRCVQGFAAGAEFGGGVLMALEHSSSKRRGMAGAVPQIGMFSGIFLANVALLLVLLLPRNVFLEWGWRVPFLFTAVLLAITLWLRYKVGETPVFEKAKREGRLSGSPVLGLFRFSWRSLATVVSAAFVTCTTSALILIVLPAYGMQMGFESSQALSLSLIALVVWVPLVVTFAHLSDKFGRKRVGRLGVILMPFAAAGAFLAMGTGSFPLAVIAILMPVIAHSVAYGPLSAWMAEAFPTKYRYGGVAISWQLASLAAGFFPLIATSC